MGSRIARNVEMVASGSATKGRNDVRADLLLRLTGDGVGHGLGEGHEIIDGFGGESAITGVLGGKTPHHAETFKTVGVARVETAIVGRRLT